MIRYFAPAIRSGLVPLLCVLLVVGLTLAVYVPAATNRDDRQTSYWHCVVVHGLWVDLPLFWGCIGRYVH